MKISILSVLKYGILLFSEVINAKNFGSGFTATF